MDVGLVAELGDFLTFTSTSQLATMFASMKIRLRGRFFAANLNPNALGDVRSALNAAALKRDSVMYVDLCRMLIKLIDDKRIFRNFTGMLARNAKCYADVVRLKLS
jgi:hypothetical protein